MDIMYQKYTPDDDEMSDAGYLMMEAQEERVRNVITSLNGDLLLPSHTVAGMFLIHGITRMETRDATGVKTVYWSVP